MTVSNINLRSPDTGGFACNGSVVNFAGDFRLLAEGDVDVILRDSEGNESTLTLTTEYTVSPTGGSYPADAFTVTTVATYASGNTITLIRAMDFTQPQAQGNSGPYLPKGVENADDRNLLLIQQQQEVLDRCVKDSPGGTSVTDPDSYLAACQAAQGGAETAEDGAEASLAAMQAAGYYLSEYASLSAAITAIGATEAELIIDQDDTMTGNITVPSNVALRFINGNVITTGSNTLTINGSLIADLYQIFNDTGGAVNGLPLIPMVYPEWFGAVGDGITDDSAELQSALTFAGAGGTLFLSNKTYDLTTGTLTASGINQRITGASHNSILLSDASSNAVLCRYNGFQVDSISIKCASAQNPDGQAIRIATDDTTPSEIYDITVRNNRLEGFGYGVVGLKMNRSIISENYIKSTGTGAAPDDGGALQLSAYTDSVIIDNIIIGDASNTFQHGMYLSGGLTRALISGNVIRNFWSHGIHVYGTADANRNDITIIGNYISDVVTGITLNRAVAGRMATNNVIISNNIIKHTTGNGIICAAKELNNITIESNTIIGTTSSDANVEIGQSSGESLRNFIIRGNILSSWGSGKTAVEFDNPVDIEALIIENNTFDPIAGGGTQAILTSDPANYGYVRVRDNQSSASTITISSSWHDAFYSYWDYGGNVWDTESINHANLITALYDFSIDGGSQGEISLGKTLPDNASIVKAWYEVVTAPTSGGAATIAFGVDANDETGLLAATAYNDAAFGLGYHDFLPDGTAANFTSKTSAERDVIIEIAAADLTAGKIRIWFEYIVSE